MNNEDEGDVYVNNAGDEDIYQNTCTPAHSNNAHSSASRQKVFKNESDHLSMEPHNLQKATETSFTSRGNPYLLQQSSLPAAASPSAFHSHGANATEDTTTSADTRHVSATTSSFSFGRK